jgi:hypothetical protein
MIHVDRVIWLLIGIHLTIYGLPLVLSNITPFVVTVGLFCALAAGIIIVLRIVLTWIMGQPTPAAP